MLNWFRRKPRERRPHVIFTPSAFQQLEAVLAREQHPAALRIFVKNPGGGAPQYDMALEAGRCAAGRRHARRCRRPAGGGRPRKPQRGRRSNRRFSGRPAAAWLPRRTGAAATDRGPDVFDASGPLAAQVQSVLEHHVNPGIAAHGGRAQLVGVKDDVVFLSLGGGCQGCSMAAVTLKQGIEQTLKEAIPRIRAVVDATDHAQGHDPFYASGAHGESPLHSHSAHQHSH